MNTKLVGAVVVATLFWSLTLCGVTGGSAGDATVAFRLNDVADGASGEILNVVVPLTLVEYYQEQSHRTASASDFPKFVTPYALKPIADALRQVYHDDEDFANCVLRLVHQIPYQEMVKEFYPVETLQRNSGDCDMVSVVAASILKAGGLDVVLLYYVGEEHMNLGVHLDDKPKDARFDIYFFEDNDVPYYVAEVTGSSWRVGECPPDLKEAEAEILKLDKSEAVSPGQVSASFTELYATSIDLDLSPVFTLEGNSLTVNGRIQPAATGQNVTIYYGTNGAPWQVLGYTETQSNGQFFYSWEPEAGFLNVRASWSGNEQYAGTTSHTENTFVFPFYLLLILVLGVTAIIISLVAGVATRSRTTPENPEDVNSLSGPSVVSFSRFGND